MSSVSARTAIMIGLALVVGASGSPARAEPAARSIPNLDDPPPTKPPKPPSTTRDPKQTISGTLRFASTAKAGTSVFVYAKRVHKGKPVGVPLAVTKLTYDGTNLPFVLDNTMALTGDVALRGSVLVMARYDQDADALSKTAGDLTGEVRVKVPARKVVIVVDTLVK